MPDISHFWMIRSTLFLLLITATPILEAQEQKPNSHQLTRDQQDRIGTPPIGQRDVGGVRSGNCANCHVKGPDPDLPEDVRPDNDGWFLGTELKIYLKDDHHYQAFSVLLNKQSQSIAKNLGLVDEQGASLAHRYSRCLSCHSSMPVSQMNLNGDYLKDDPRKNFLYTTGVSCEACHGPSGGKEGWGLAHQLRPDDPDDADRWRWLSPQEKFDKFGYWDVSSPRTQTRICLSCHLGNVEQKKVITHEMYAAGHPPLPSFELSQFVHQMPKHWRRLDQKNPELVEDFLRRKHQKTEMILDELATTRASLVSALVVLEESMQLTVDMIDGRDPEVQWPELANYACFNCHHELQQNGWRKMRRLTSKPGRPTLHEWPFALARVLSTTFQGEGKTFELESKINAVSSALNERPFGDCAQLKSSATGLIVATRAMIEALTKKAIREDQARAWMNGIAEHASQEQSDYDTARQYVWAYERTQTGLNFPDGNFARLEIELIPEKWTSELKVFNELEGKHFVLWLRGNREDGTVSQPNPDKIIPAGRKQFAIDMTTLLQKISNHDPKAVQRAFQQLKNGHGEATRKE